MNPPLDRNQYQCAECGGIFDKGWTDEEARTEQDDNGWGELPDNMMAVVCDDCYKKLECEWLRP